MSKDKKLIFYCNYHKTIYRNEKNNYTIFSVKTDDIKMAEYEDRYSKVICKGYIPLYTQNMPLKITGEVITDRNNEKQIYVREIIEEVESRKVAINYLIETCKGIGIKTATKIVDKLGIHLFNYTRENLLNFISEEKALNILQTIESTKIQREIFEFLAKYGCSYLDAIKIYKEFGNVAISKVTSNPYVTHLPFSVKEKIALELNFDFFDDRRINGIIDEIFEKDLGHTYIDIKQLKILIRFLEKLSPYDAVLPIELIINQVRKNKRYIIEKASPIRIFRKDLWFSEINIVKNIKRIENTKEKFPFDRKMIEEIEKRDGISYDEGQKKAVENILSSSGFKILTGGPGTGKTTVINIIIEIYSKMFPDKKIELCAPTGRAAQRMTETTKREAKTVHKTLEYTIKNNITSYLNEDNPIKADFIIVDECSMIDSKLMSMILDAVQSGSLFLFVGDEDQLPSVGSGNVLHDIMDSKKIQVNRLNRIFRQKEESSIVTNCFKVKKGKNNLKQEKDFEIINTNSDKELIKVLTENIEKYYDKNNPYAVQVLSPSKKGEIGSNNINKILQKLVNNVDNSNEKKIYYGSNVFRINDKIILNKNNYSNDTPYHNGDIGLIKDIINSDLILDINNKKVRLTKENLEDLSLSYDITIHKSQGSEYETVIIVLPINPRNMLQRKLLFTAISRAKSKVIIITQENSLELAIANIKSNERKTSLTEKILDIKYETIHSSKK